MVDRYAPPHIQDVIVRNRLFSLLNDHEPIQNILITGQAAQGKTTLAASFLQQVSYPVLWLHLSEHDNAHARLFDRIFTAVRLLSDRKEPETGLPVSSGVLGSQKMLARHLEFLSMLLEELPGRVCLVLDDFENLKENSDGFQLAHGLLLRRFAKLKLFILSRTRPPFNTVQLKMARNIFILENDDLSFTLEETADFFSDKPSVTYEAVKKIREITGGWAGGLTLVAESIRHLTDPMTIPDHLSADLFSYFSQEIYNRLPVTIREFLIQTSVLDEIQLDVVSRIFDPKQSLAVLAELEKRNLFIQRIESEGESPRFKYHQLFRNFLTRNLIKTMGRDHYRQLNRTAGTIFWEKKDHESAVCYFIRAGAFDDLIRIIKIKATDYIITGKMAQLEKWLQKLPPDRVERDPWLIFFSALARRIRGGRKNIARFRQALQLFEALNDTKGILLSVGYLIEAAVFIRLPAPDVLKWIEKGEAVLADIGSKDRYLWAKALLLQQIGFGYIAGYANLPKGISACRNAILMARQIENPGVILNARIIMTFAHVQTGDFSGARQMLTRISRMTRDSLNPEYRALKSIVDINFALKNGRFEDTRHLLDLSESDIEKFGLIFLYPGFIEAKALYYIYTGQYDDARRMADHLNDFSILEGSDFYKGISFRIKALSDFQEGRYQRADRHITTALTEFAPERKGRIQHVITRQLAGMIHFKTGRLDQAAVDFQEVLGYFETTAFDLNHVETCLALGLTLWRSENWDAGRTMLTAGFEKALTGRYLFFPMLSREMVVSALVLQAAQGQRPEMMDYLKDLMAGCPREMVRREMDRVLGAVHKTDKAAAVRRLEPIYKALLPRLFINTLGHFDIFLGTDILEKGRFDGQKPLMLLKAMVVRGMTDIPKDMLVDDLWPDADAAAGDKNFKTNFHRLRRALEPEPDQTFGYAYIIQKAGIVSLNPELVRLDTDAFVAYAAAGTEHEKSFRFNPALDCYDKALELYRGEYFADDPYYEPAMQKRSMFRARYFELIEKKARLLEEQDKTDEAIAAWHQLLDTDPYSETACRNLMILYADAGRRQQALDLFHDYRARLNTDLGADVDEQTLSVLSMIS